MPLLDLKTAGLWFVFTPDAKRFVRDFNAFVGADPCVGPNWRADTSVRPYELKYSEATRMSKQRRYTGGPYPPPPGVPMMSRSPAATRAVNLADCSSVWPSCVR